MFRKFILIAILISASSFSLPVVASNYDTPKMPILVEALEIDKLQITLDKNLNGYLLGKKKKKLIISSATKAYSKDVEVPLMKARNQKNKPVIASYDFKTGHVIRIDW